MKSRLTFDSQLKIALLQIGIQTIYSENDHASLLQRQRKWYHHSKEKTDTYKGFSGIPRLNGAILRKKKNKKNNKPEMAVVIVVFIYNAVIDA